LNLSILDNSLIRDSIQILIGPFYTVLDVNVRIDTVNHTWDSDLSFYLQKGSIGVKIINRVGGSGDNFIGTILDDQASEPIASGTAPFTGSFIPSNPLSVFNSQSTSGYWKLIITDTVGGDTGFLKAWCIVISYTSSPGVEETIEIPNYYFLAQNYPNPFNPVTIIKFGLPQGENVKLVVYDILGREVKTLINEFRNSGVQEVSFDATNLASGVYFYRIEVRQAGSSTVKFIDVKKMLLVK
jgi:hypothetical protein